MTDTDYYFPEGDWCSVFNTTAMGCITGPANVSLPSRLYQFHVHIREGSIIPMTLGAIGADSNVTKTADI